MQRDAFVIANYSEETLEGDAHADIQRYVEDYQQPLGRHGWSSTDATATSWPIPGSLGTDLVVSARAGRRSTPRWPATS